MLLAVLAGGALVAQARGGSGAGAGFGAFGLICPLIYLALIIVAIVGLWKVFTKAGEPGWASIIPIYNGMVLCRIGGKPEWWVLLMLIPLVNIVISLLVSLGVAEKFGQGTGYGIGLWLLGFIFYPMLGFGSAEYVGGKRRRRLRDDDDYDRPAPRMRRRNDDDDRYRRPRDEFEEGRPRRRRVEDDEEDRPRRRRPVDEDDGGRPRRRRVEDNEEDRPRRRRAEEDDEDRPRRRRPVDEDD